MRLLGAVLVVVLVATVYYLAHIEPLSRNSLERLPMITKKESMGQDNYSKKENRTERIDRWLMSRLVTMWQKISRKTIDQPPLAESMEMIGGNYGDPVFIRIFKKEELLEVWMKREGKYHLIQTYIICCYSGDLGPKLQEGDGQSPEGFYRVTKGLLNPNSKFHLAFNIGYPNAYDRAHARTGSFIMVHGSCVSIGCYAMTDEKIEEIYALVERALVKGQRSVPVHIFPFRMSDEAMAAYSDHEWHSFWENLKEGHDIFEQSHRAPTVAVRNKRYVFKTTLVKAEN